jgi:hypothetical protein
MAELVKAGAGWEDVRDVWPGPIDQVPLLDTSPAVLPTVAWEDTSMVETDTIDLTVEKQPEPSYS